MASDQAGPVKDRIPPRLINSTLRGTIEDIVFYWTTSITTEPSITVHFWGNDQHNTTVLANVRLLASEEIGTTDFTIEGTGSTTAIHRGHVGALEIPYYDEDQSGEFHVTIQNALSTDLEAGDWKLEFGYRPEFGG